MTTTTEPTAMHRDDPRARPHRDPGAHLLVGLPREPQGVRRGERHAVGRRRARPPSTATSASRSRSTSPAPTARWPASGRRTASTWASPTRTPDVDALLRRRHAPPSRPGATPGPDARAERRLEILARINARSHEIAHAVMHTSGQAFAMAFQAGGPHAQDRAPGGGGVRLRRDDPARRAGRLGEAAGQARRRSG